MKIALALFLVFGCEKDDLSKNDSGTPDSGADTDAGTSIDAEPDAGPEDLGPYPCDPLNVTDPATPAATTGQIDVIDYDYWDEIDGRRSRVRNAGLNFLTGTLPPIPLASAALFPGIPVDQCAVVDIPIPMMSLGPARNVGTRIALRNEAGDKSIIIRRIVETDGIRYTPATQQDLLNFFDPEYLGFDERWTYATEGDAAADIRPAEATLEPFDDFVVSPAVSSSSTAVAIDGMFTWTSTGTPGLFSIILGRALNPEGDGRYAVCNAQDDGSFAIPSGIIAEFGPTPGLAFDVIISRSSVAPFCNEGVTSGLILHIVAFIGAGVAP